MYMWRKAQLDPQSQTLSRLGLFKSSDLLFSDFSFLSVGLFPGSHRMAAGIARLTFLQLWKLIGKKDFSDRFSKDFWVDSHLTYMLPPSYLQLIITRPGSYAHLCTGSRVRECRGVDSLKKRRERIFKLISQKLFLVELSLIYC